MNFILTTIFYVALQTIFYFKNDGPELGWLASFGLLYFATSAADLLAPRGGSRW